jgi:hypothetical protein
MAIQKWVIAIQAKAAGCSKPEAQHRTIEDFGDPRTPA